MIFQQQGALTRGKTKEGKDLGLQDDSLYGRLKACLTLQGYYRETLRSLRDSLGQTTNMSHFPSLSSVGGPGSFTTRWVHALCGSVRSLYATCVHRCVVNVYEVSKFYLLIDEWRKNGDYLHFVPKKSE